MDDGSVIYIESNICESALCVAASRADDVDYKHTKSGDRKGTYLYLKYKTKEYRYARVLSLNTPDGTNRENCHRFAMMKVAMINRVGKAKRAER